MMPIHVTNFGSSLSKPSLLDVIFLNKYWNFHQILAEKILKWMTVKVHDFLIRETIQDRCHMFHDQSQSILWSRWSSQKIFFRSSRSKTMLNEIKRSIFGNMELGPVDLIFAAVFILNTVSFISKMLRSGLTFRWIIFSQSEHEMKASIWNFKIFIFKSKLSFLRGKSQKW